MWDERSEGSEGYKSPAAKRTESLTNHVVPVAENYYIRINADKTMEVSDNINSIDVLIIIFAVIFFVCWTIWIVRLMVCKYRLKNSNALLLKRYHELKLEQKKSEMYEERLDSLSLGKDGEVGLGENEKSGLDENLRLFRKLDNQLRQSKIYKNAKVSKDELSALIGVEKTKFEEVFHDAYPQGSVNDWIDSVRLSYALEALKKWKDEKTEKKPSDEEKETHLTGIATEAGFSNIKALNNACKKHIGISLVYVLKSL